MSDPLETLSPEADQIDAASVYRAQQMLQDERRWQMSLELKPAEGVAIDVSEAGLAKTAEKAKLLPETAPTPETVQPAMEQLQQDPGAKSIGDSVLKTLTGFTVDELHQAVVTGTLGEKISLRISDPMGNIAEQMARVEGQRQGLPPDVIEKTATALGMAMGALFPPGGGKGIKKGTEKLAERIQGIRAITKVPVERGFIRLYRGEGTEKAALPDWAKANAGEWFTSSRSKAEQFQKERAGVLKYVDIPESELQSYKVERGAFDEFLIPKVVQENRGAAILRTSAQETASEIVGGVKQIHPNINIERVYATADVKAAMQRINDLEVERLATTRKRVTHEATIAASEEALSLEDALQLPPERLLDPAKQTALRDRLNAASAYALTVANKLLKGTPEEIAQAEKELPLISAIAGELAFKDETVGAMFARGLESRKILSEASRQLMPLDELQTLAQQAAGMDPKRLAARLIALEKPAERLGFFGQMGRVLRVGKNQFYAAWINALLSGPQTHAVNILGTGISTAWAPEERFLSAVADLGQWAATGQRSVYLGETPAMYIGLGFGSVEALRLFGKIAREEAKLLKGQVPELISPYGSGQKMERFVSAERLTNPESFVGHAADYLEAGIGTPGRWLSEEDTMGKAVNYRMEIWALAYRMAALEGNHGIDLAKRMWHYVQHPTPQMMEKAMQFSSVQTFTADLATLGRTGQIGQAAMKIRAAVPAGPLIAPFVTTSTNLAHYNLERSPILNLAMDTLRADLKAGGERAALAMGKIGTSAMIGTAFMTLYLNGKITGGGPASRELARVLGDEAPPLYNIQIGQTYFSFNRLDTLGQTFGILADYAEIAAQLPEESRTQFVMAYFLATARNVQSRSFMLGVSNAFDAMMDPEGKAAKMIEGFARTGVPTGVRQFTRTMVDPVERQARDLTELQTLLNAMKSGIPGVSDTLPPRRNRFADEITPLPGWGPDLISPFYYRGVTTDPMVQELIRITKSVGKSPITMPKPLVWGTKEPRSLEAKDVDILSEGVPLAAWEFDRLLVLAGKGREAGAIEGKDFSEFQSLPPFRTAIKETMASAEWKEAKTDVMKYLILRRIDNAYQQAARAQLMKENDPLMQAVTDKIGQRAKALGASEEQVREQLGQSLGR